MQLNNILIIVTNFLVNVVHCFLNIIVMAYGIFLESDDVFINLLKTRVYLLSQSDVSCIDTILCIHSFQSFFRDFL